LKALLINFGKTIRTHDLDEILDEIQRESVIRGDEIMQDVDKVTVHYTIARYPDATNAVPARLYSKEDAEDLIKRAERAIEWVKRYLQ
ncbi:DNA-binding protein, partial [Acidianus hospitalis]